MGDQEEDFANLLGRFLVRMGFTQQELANKIGMHRNTIIKWMNRTSWPTSRGQVLRVADELSLLKEERKALIQAAGFSLERWPTEVWTVAEPRNMFFTGREMVFQSLRALLVPGSTTALTQAISGLGGIGKTHTAVEYSYRFHQDYEAILWLQADSWEILVSACLKLADILELPEQKDPDQIIEGVQRWLQKHRHWLLILDNIENPQEILPKFVPAGHQGCVLITTRVQNVEPLAQTQLLSTMSEQEGILFLLRRTTRIASKAELEKISPEQYNEAKQIWELLDGLPLALDQAGAYILETDCSFFAYQEQYARRRAKLLPRRGKRFIGHEASVATTFSLAFEKIKALNQLAADILRTCSLLYSETIPEEIFQEGVALLELSSVENGSLDEALGVLQDYSLVLRNHERKLLSIHRLVQAVLQDEMEETERQRWVKRVVLAVNLVFPSAEPSTWQQCEQLLPHALLVTEYIETDHIIIEEAGHLLFNTASYLKDRARYSAAEPLYLRALMIYEQQLGLEHPQVSYLLNGLAELYREQGKYEQAEPLYLRALRIREEQLGPEHPDVATSLNNLANLYLEQGKYEQAEPLYLRALSIREKQLGPEHPLVANPLNNLGELYREQGKYEQAEPLYLRAIRIWEQQLGPEHPLVANPLNNLGELYREQGKYEQAEPLHLRALRIREEQLGPEHPLVANSLSGLANIYLVQDRYEQAEPLYLRALVIYEQQLGPEHYFVANQLNNLANIYLAQDKYEQAESLYLRAIRIGEQTLGPNHLLVGHPLNNLAELYLEQGKYEQAEPLLQRALQIWERHVDQLLIAHPLNNLANLYREQGKYAQAEPLYQHALHIREQAQGPQHPETAEIMHDLARYWEVQGNREEAKAWYTRALAIREQVLGAHHPKTTETRTSLIALLHTMGQHEDAAQLEAAQSEQRTHEDERKAHPEE